MASVIIAAHNEEAVLGATLEALRASSADMQVIVVPNGCSDATTSVAASSPGVQVIELAEGSKPKALNAGEALAGSWPRIYLDADILVPPEAVAALRDALEVPGILAAVPGRSLGVAGRPWPVRAYAAIHSRLPAMRDGLYGRGMIALSKEGRSRFQDFPILVADDVFLDALFEQREKAHVDSVRVVVEMPFTTGDLLRRLVRVRRGLAALRQAAATGKVQAEVRRPDRWSWLRDVVRREPWLAPAGFTYAVINLIAGARARRGSVSSMEWGRDESTRS